MYDVQLNTAAIEWTTLDFPGVFLKTLRQDAASGGMTVMTRMQPGAMIPAHSHTRADETVYVLEGDFIEDGVAYGPGSFFAGAAGMVHGPHGTRGGCVLLTTFSAALDFVIAE
jgi:quercetin dioxygenase-like cupin family protein